MDKYEAVVQSLQERSQQVLPLRYRRQSPPGPVPVEALCEYEGEQVQPGGARLPWDQMGLTGTEWDRMGPTGIEWD